MRQHCVLERGHSRQQVEALKNEPDLAVAHFRARGVAELAGIGTVEHIGAARSACPGSR